jgi:sensor histidine kinase YesM
LGLILYISLCYFSASAANEPPPDTSFGSNSNSVFRLEHLSNDKVTQAYIQFIIDDTTGWMGIENLTINELEGKDELFIKFKLPITHWSDPSLMLNGYSSGFEIYNYNKKIYESGNSQNEKDFEYYNLHYIPLDSNYAGTIIVIRVHIDDILNIISFSSVSIGNSKDLVSRVFKERSSILRSGLVGFTLGIFLIFAGIIAFIIFVLRRKKIDSLLLFFTLFTITEGYTLCVDLLFQIIPISPKTFIYSNVISSSLIPIGLLGVFFGISGYLRKPLFYIMMSIHVVFTAFYLLYLGRYDLEFFYWVLILVDIFVCMYAFWKSKLFKNKNFRIPIISIGILVVLVILDIFAVFQIFYIAEDLASYGMVLMVLAFGYYIERNYTKNQQQVYSYKTELAMAQNKLLLLENESIISQYEVLKNQVNPHFLFNSLNTLSSLIRFDPEKAQNFIGEFSDVYRYVLDVKDKILVSVAEELSFVNSYLYLQKLRFGNNLNCEIIISDSCMQEFIVPLSMQMLVENAIKHNEISETFPLNISIECKDSWLIVSNNLNRVDSSLHSKKMGLKNLSERYHLISEKKVEFYIENNRYIAKIPMIHEDES